MDYSLTEAGQDRLASRFVDEAAAVAVGGGNTAVSTTDTSLDSEEYRASVTQKEATVTTTNTTGTVRASIVVVGGVTVPANSDLYELGIFDDNGGLLYRQVSDQPRQTGSGQSLQIESELTVVPYNQ